MSSVLSAEDAVAAAMERIRSWRRTIVFRCACGHQDRFTQTMDELMTGNERHFMVSPHPCRWQRDVDGAFERRYGTITLTPEQIEATRFDRGAFQALMDREFAGAYARIVDPPEVVPIRQQMDRVSPPAPTPEPEPTPEPQLSDVAARGAALEYD